MTAPGCTCRSLKKRETCTAQGVKRALTSTQVQRQMVARRQPNGSRDQHQLTVRKPCEKSSQQIIRQVKKVSNARKAKKAQGQRIDRLGVVPPWSDPTSPSGFSVQVASKRRANSMHTTNCLHSALASSTRTQVWNPGSCPHQPGASSMTQEALSTCHQHLDKSFDTLSVLWTLAVAPAQQYRTGQGAACLSGRPRSGTPPPSDHSPARPEIDIGQASDGQSARQGRHA